MSKKHRYAWDTSVFLAWLNQENSAPLADIDLVLKDIHDNEATLIVAVTVYTEILRAKHSKEQVQKFDGFLQRSNVLRVDTSFVIAKKAEEIRSRAIDNAKRGQKRNIKTPDVWWTPKVGQQSRLDKVQSVGLGGPRAPYQRARTDAEVGPRSGFRLILKIVSHNFVMIFSSPDRQDL